MKASRLARLLLALSPAIKSRRVRIALLLVTLALMVFGGDQVLAGEPLPPAAAVVCPFNADPTVYTAAVIYTRDGATYRFLRISGATMAAWDAARVVRVGGVGVPYDNVRLIDGRCA